MHALLSWTDPCQSRGAISLDCRADGSCCHLLTDIGRLRREDSWWLPSESRFTSLIQIGGRSADRLIGVGRFQDSAPKGKGHGCFEEEARTQGKSCELKAKLFFGPQLERASTDCKNILMRIIVLWISLKMKRSQPPSLSN